jgi:hypothetical protein
MKSFRNFAKNEWGFNQNNSPIGYKPPNKIP